MLRHSVGFSDAVLLVIGLPVSPLAVSAAVRYETTPSAFQKLQSAFTPFECGTVAANLAVGI